MLVERVKNHIANGSPNSEFSVQDEEILLYIDEAVPVVMKGQMFENAKVVGFLEVPEAYLVTYNFTVSSQQPSTREWYITLPQTPIALPNGYNINDAYFADEENGKGGSLNFISAKRLSYVDDMPKMSGVSARVEGVTVLMKSYDGSPLINYKVWVQMPVSRTADLDAVYTIPDDAISGINTYVINKIIERYKLPKDIVKDNLPSGNKN